MVLLGDETLRFEKLSGGEPVVDDRRPRGNLPPQSGLFLGRGRELVEIAGRWPIRRQWSCSPGRRA